MAIDRLQALTEQYAQALENYCLNPDRDDLAAALGEQAAAAGLTLTDLIQLHQQTLDTGLESVPKTQDGVALAKRIAAFLAQSLLPLQQAALQERQQVETALQQLNTDLESRVQARTAELGQKNAELEALFQIFPDSFFRVAADGTYLECRGNSSGDFYLPPEELIGRKVQEVLPSPIGHEFHATYQDVVRRNEQVTMEYALTIDGIEKYYEARFVPLQPDQVVAIVRNIGARKTAEAALQASEQNLRTIFNTVNHELWVHDIHGNILDVNARVLELIGEDEAQVLQRSILDDCFTSTHALLQTYWQRALNGESIHFELQAPHPRSGATLDLDIMLNRMIRDGSAVILATVQDISDRKRNEATRAQIEQTLRSREAELRHDRALFAGVFEASADAIFLVSPVTNCILNCNQRAVALFEVEHREALIGIVSSTFHKEPFLPEDIAQAAAALETSGGWSREFEYVTRKGNLFWGGCTAKRLYIDGEPLHLLRVTDITAYKRAEQRLQRQADAAQLLATIAQTISQSMQLDNVLAPCLEQIRQFFQSDRVLICRFDANDAIAIELEAVSQPAFSLLGQTLYAPCFGQDWAERYRQGHFVACNDSHAEAIASCDASFLTQIQVRASLTVAVLQANQLWGLLIVHQCAAPHHWQASEIDLLKQLGLQIGIASQKASLYTQLETELAERRRAEYTIAQQVQRERLLRTLSQQIRQSLRLEQILETTVTEIQRLLAADRAIVFRLNRDRSGVIIQEANLGRHPVITEMYLTDRHFPQASYDFYLTGQARAIDRANDDAHTACLLDFMEQIGVKSKLVAPILQTLDDDTPVVWGLLIVHACDEYRHWLPDEISLLQQLATQVGIAIQQANLYSQIKDELAQKKVLLKEIHHRVKNNLQVVSSLLALQADAVQDATVLAALQDSDNRLQAMALIHETLYQSDNLGRLDFSNYIQRLADNILLANSRHLNAINLTYALQPVFLTLDTAIPCGLLLNELVTNAIKHAFPDGQQGTICLTLQPAPTCSTAPPEQPISTANFTIAPTDVSSQAAPRYVLSISDDGIGMPANLDLEKTKSLGLRIASDLAQQLRGSLVLKRSNGTQFHLTFTDLGYRKRL